jgi:phage shock protein A
VYAIDDELLARLRSRLNHHRDIAQELRRQVARLQRRVDELQQEITELRTKAADAKWSLEP